VVVVEELLLVLVHAPATLLNPPPHFKVVLATPMSTISVVVKKKLVRLN
jgi:hypothetical protein